MTEPATLAEHAVPAWAGLAYLIAGVLFILALRGLSSPTSSRRGNRFGMIGMLIAVVTTLVLHGTGLVEIAVAIAIGGAIGFVTARKIAMTDMPQLVAAYAEPFAVSSALGMLRLSRAIAETPARVVLTGDGGDDGLRRRLHFQRRGLRLQQSVQGRRFPGGSADDRLHGVREPGIRS